MLFWFLGLRPCTEISINGSAVRPLRGEVKCSKCFVLCRVCDSTYLLEPSTQIQLGSGSAIVVGHHTSWCVLTSAAICDPNWPLYVRKKKKKKIYPKSHLPRYKCSLASSPSHAFSPWIVATTLRVCRLVRNSRYQIPCQVPVAKRPLEMGIFTEAPISADLI
jgi:hypothetical protein